MIRLFSIEDHWMVIDGLKAKFRADRDKISIACYADTIDSALGIESELFDIILLDLLIPGTDPVENVLKLKTCYPGKPIVILTSEEQSVWEDQMCEAGVQAYLTKHDNRKKIKSVIERVALGEDFCKKKILDSQPLFQGYRQETYELKPSQKAILSLYIKELSFKEIASNTFMTESAVAKVMARLRKQFKVKSNTGLIRMVIDKKML